MSINLIITENQQSKTTGFILAILCLVSIFVMLHHPSVSSEHVHQQIQEINNEAKINTLVHGVLIAFVILISFCLTYYAKLRGLNRSSVLYGLILYWVGTLVMVLAALMSGIVEPQLAGHYSRATDIQGEVFKGLFLLAFEMNQAFAYFAVFCWSGTMCFWAVDMLYQNKFAKVIGIFSLVAALVIITSLLLGWVHLSVTGMTLILIVTSGWQLGIAYAIYCHPLSKV